MTKKDFFKAVAEGKMNADIQTKAKELLESAEKSNAKRSKAQTENKNKNIQLATAFAEKIGNRWLAASEIFVLVKDMEGVTSTSKVSAVCKVGVEEGIFEVRNDYKVGGEGSKVKGYKPISITREEEAEEEEEIEEEKEIESTEW
jgi:hypothetical protein